MQVRVLPKTSPSLVLCILPVGQCCMLAYTRARSRVAASRAYTWWYAKLLLYFSSILDGFELVLQAIVNKATAEASAAAAAPKATAGGSSSSLGASDPSGVNGAPKLLFSLGVNLGDARGKVPLDVHDGADPADVAQKFATQYGLGSKEVAQLTDAIVKEARHKVLASAN